MILALAATQLEMLPFRRQWPEAAPPCLTLVTGVGPVETALRLTKFFCDNNGQLEAVVNFGIGGAYLQAEGGCQPGLLDVCLATQEVMGDFGISLAEGMDYLDAQLTGELIQLMDTSLLRKSRDLFDRLGIAHHAGVFITVNGITGTARRGAMLRERWQGICENMEGAAIARVCREFAVPCLEIRVISNFVENREPTNWRIREACRKAGETAAALIRGMSA